MPMSVYNNHNHDGILSSGGESTELSFRVRVIPGSLLSFPTPPSPPLDSPPKPSHLCKIAVVGDAYCGKSALAQRFIHRRYANMIGADGGEDRDGNININGAASATSNSVGTSLGASIGTSYEGLLEPTLAEYHKKDVTISEQKIDINQRKKEDTSSDENDTLEHEKRAVCIRVQLWDMNIHQHFINQQAEPESNSCNHSLHSETSSMPSSPRHTANIAPLLPLLKRVNGIMIVCRCPLPPTSFSQSSNASYDSHTSNASCSEWLALDSLEKHIKRWKTSLHDQLSNESQQSFTFVLLSCADLVIAEYSPREWMRLSDRMQEICKNCGIDSWKVGTCMDTTTSGATIDGNFSPQSTLLQRMMHKQRQILEDMEDSVEAAFIDLISLCLCGSK